MANMRMIRSELTGEPYYLESRTGRLFRRMVGALAWPYGETEGCVMVLGESHGNGNVYGGRHHVYVLDEERSINATALFDAMGIMQDQWLVRVWSTPITDNRVWMLDDWNDQRRRARLRRLSIADPVGLAGKGEGQIPFYHTLVQRRTLDEKTLFLGDRCSAAPDIDRMDEQDTNKKVIEYPGAAALFFALAEIDLNPMPESEQRQNKHRGPADPLGGY